MGLAPIVLFVYNRPSHVKQTIESLQKNELAEQSELFIFSDAPRTDEVQDNVKKVREYIKTIRGFKKITIVERTENHGLAKSIISGVTEIVNKFGRIIVLEDDMVSSPYFLRFMNEALELYKNEEKVISIHAYVYPVRAQLPKTFFLIGADCWGWATWKRGWDLFEPDGKKLLTEIRERHLEKVFDFNNTYPFTKMLEDQIRGGNNSWAVRWYASAFLKDKLTLYPGKSLIKNVGLDDSGTHCNVTNIYDTQIYREPIAITNILLEENTFAKKEIEKYFKSVKPDFIDRIKNRMFKIFH